MTPTGEIPESGAGPTREPLQIARGVWHVHTGDAVYIVNFQARTLERRPGINADLRSTDRPRPLRSVEICRVGEPAFLTVFDDESSTGFRWQTTAEVTRIETVTGAQ